MSDNFFFNSVVILKYFVSFYFSYNYDYFYKFFKVNNNYLLFTFLEMFNKLLYLNEQAVNSEEKEDNPLIVHLSSILS